MLRNRFIYAYRGDTFRESDLHPGAHRAELDGRVVLVDGPGGCVRL